MHQQSGRTFIFIWLFFISCECATHQYDIYVSLEGSSGNPGTIDQPIPSPHEAAIRARNIKKDQEVTIWLAGGTYNTPNAIDLGIADSMTNWRAMPNEKPVISGGRLLPKWQMDENGLYFSTLDESYPKQIRELFINGKRATRARHPNNGYLRIAQAGEDKRTNFYFNQGDFPEMQSPKNLELVLLHDWSISRIVVESIDWTKYHLTTVDWIGAKVLDFFNLTNWEKQPRYFLENAREFLDSPGEWFYDESSRNIFYFPKPEDDTHTIEAVVPMASQLLTIQGNRTTREKVNNITFEGITFEHTAWQLPTDGYCGIQACMFDNRSGKSENWDWVPAAIEVDLATSCHFKECTVGHAGGSGIWLRQDTDNCSISSCHIYDISGNGINIGEGQKRLADVEGKSWWQTNPEQATSEIEVSNSLIEQCGQQFYGAVGIWGGLVAKTNIKRNEIRNLPYTGISIGWMWNPQPTPCRENTIHGNHIHQVLNKLSDGGGIYSLGLQPGSRIANNLIHDVKLNAGRAESNGMFLDEGVTDVVVENNIIYNIAKSPLRFHRATTNLVRNNILAHNEGIPPIQYNNTKENDIEKTGNQIIGQHVPGELEKLNQLLDDRKFEFGPERSQ